MSAALSLKALRESATPKVTVRKMGERLGMPAQSYARYEDPKLFKRPFLPMSLARSVASVLADHGIDRAQVMRLAGVEGDQPASLTRGEEAWLIVWRALTPGQRRLVLDQLYCSLGWKEPDGEPDFAPALSKVA